ncbi:class A beta-lactamase-related serine hydrolase [Ktedonosporobacter rubrisoli]|uniref:Class A beta-lactamase-related serine hydrolase n=1 Tax=Ktedonosporobacter rubrisoli TaxID=2509675 RepID=A0A4P6JLJ8_KTERU|nr:serine hydrolase domain-containing protein [Ktedonosporobacter rubrisoli]QBD76127.1 class A beta-lactamase-related serine hydrolase [Ktedonosporobacter rubrisoli]
MVSQKELTSVFASLAQEHDLSGSVLISQGGEVIFEKAYGYASRQLKVPNVLQTKFHIASMSKMFIAMAALILYEQGLLELQERPATYLPALAALDEKITLHHLLSHTSGLEEIYDISNLHFEMHKLKNEKGELLNYLLKLPQLFRPGEGWHYSSTGYILMGYLMEKVTGLAFGELMKRYVLTPLSMTDTGHDLPRRINPGRAYGHTVKNGELSNADNDRLSLFEEAPGELYSTVQDLKKWCDAMFDCPLVSPQTLKLMFTPYGQVNPPLHYGYGWFLGPHFRMHGGATAGFLARIKQYPAQKVSIVLLFNSDHMSLDVILDALDPLIDG